MDILKLKQQLVCLLTLCLFQAASTNVKADEKFAVSMFLNGASPQQPAALLEYWRPGLGIGAEIQYTLKKGSLLAFRLTSQLLNYDREKKRDELMALYPWWGIHNMWDGDARYYMWSLRFKQSLTPPDYLVGCYLGIGVTYYDMRYSKLTIINKINQFFMEVDYDSSRKFGVSGSIGCDLRIFKRVHGFLEAHYYYILTEPKITSFISASLGLQVYII